jgi:PadR family transcriptional regulator PadR
MADAIDDYLAKIERDLATGVLNILVLNHVERNGPVHGYALVRALEESTQSTFTFKEATVYAILKDAQRLELVKSALAESPQGPPRKYYTITAKGRRVLDAAAPLWARIREATDPVLDRARGSRR